MTIIQTLVGLAAAFLLLMFGYMWGTADGDKRVAQVRAIAARRKLRLRAQREEIRWYQRHWAPDTDDERPETPYEPRRHKTDEPEPQTETTARGRFAVLNGLRADLYRAVNQADICKWNGCTSLRRPSSGFCQEHDDMFSPARSAAVKANANRVLADGGDWSLLSVLHGGHDEQHDDSDLPLFRDTTDALTGLTAAYRVLCETELPVTSATWPGSGDTAIPTRRGEDEMPTPLPPTKPVAAAIAMRQIALAPKVGV